MSMNTSCNLLSKKCLPCEGKMSPLTPAEYTPLLQELSSWEVIDEKQIKKEWVFQNFLEAMGFLNKVASLAEAEWHHPDLYLYNYKQVRIILSTHAVDGLSENDFILAAKIDQL